MKLLKTKTIITEDHTTNTLETKVERTYVKEDIKLRFTLDEQDKVLSYVWLITNPNRVVIDRSFTEVAKEKYWTCIDYGEHLVRPRTLKDINNLDINNFLYCNDREGIFLKDYNDVFIDRTLKFDYIGYPLSDDYLCKDLKTTLEDVKAFMDKHPWIKSCEIEDIPYYNAKYNNQQTLELVVTFPGDLIKEIPHRGELLKYLLVQWDASLKDEYYGV